VREVREVREVRQVRQVRFAALRLDAMHSIQICNQQLTNN
jgi:hypothetical protein